MQQRDHTAINPSARVECKSIDAAVWAEGAACDFRIGKRTDVWRIELPANPHFLSSLLTQAESAHIQRYRNPADRNLRITARVALKALLSKYTAIPVDEITIEHQHGAKPRLTGANGIEYNISHSGKWVLIAIANTPVGIDVEKINPQFASIDSAFSMAENNWLKQTPDKGTAFFALWTRKEALLKAAGKGIINELDTVPCLDGSHAVPSALGLKDYWQLSSFIVDNEHAASVATINGDLRFWNMPIFGLIAPKFSDSIT